MGNVCNICGETSTVCAYWEINIEIKGMQSFQMTVCEDCFIDNQMRNKIDKCIELIESKKGG